MKHISHAEKDGANGVDEEWMQFLHETTSTKQFPSSNIITNLSFFSNGQDEDKCEDKGEDKEKVGSDKDSLLNPSNEDLSVPEPTPVNISTQSKIIYLNSQIKMDWFWGIPIMDYYKETNGIIKKEMLIKSESIEELNRNISIIANARDKHRDSSSPNIIIPFEEILLSCIHTEKRFEDKRKVVVGICKKDIEVNHRKKKGAFHNCFVMIYRILFEGVYRDVHVKCFNTGQMEIPGMQNPALLSLVKEHILMTLSEQRDKEQRDKERDKERDAADEIIPLLSFEEGKDEIILTNSGFNAGYFIDKNAIYQILKLKYRMDTIYDPDSYPGVQCKYYFNQLLDFDDPMQNGNAVHCKNVNKEEQQIGKRVIRLPKHVLQVCIFIFRTGSILINGKCDESVVQHIHRFMCKILRAHYSELKEKVHGLHCGPPMVEAAAKKPEDDVDGEQDVGEDVGVGEGGDDEEEQQVPLITTSSKKIKFKKKWIDYDESNIVFKIPRSSVAHMFKSTQLQENIFKNETINIGGGREVSCDARVI